MTVALGLAAALCWAIDNLISVRISRSLPAAPALGWILFRVARRLTGLARLGRYARRTSPTRSLLLALLSAPCYLAGNAFFLLALRRGSLSIVAPLVGLEGGIAALFGILVLGQAIGLVTAIGLVLAVIGGLLAALDRGMRGAGGVGWALASATAYGATFVCYGEATGLSPIGVVLTTRAASALLVGVWLLVRREPLGVSAQMARATIALGVSSPRVHALRDRGAIGPIAVASVAGAQFATLAERWECSSR